MALMSSRMTWRELCRSDRFKGLWVAIDNCRYDQSTRQPVEGDVVDADPEFSELCARMREKGQTSCTILFCDSDVYVEGDGSGPGRDRIGFSGRSA